MRRVALTTLGAGLVVGAAAPMASAATVADEVPLVSALTDSVMAAAEPLSPMAPENSPADSALIASVPLSSTAPENSPAPAENALNASAPLGSMAPESSPAPAENALTASAPLSSTAPESRPAPADGALAASAPRGSMAPASGLADSALALSTAALSRANANWSHVGRLKLYPFAGTGLDPLSNMVSTNLGGIPVSTAPVTQMMEDGLPVTDLPVVGAIFGTPQG